MVPAHATGFGVDVAPGTGPVVDQPFRSAADLVRLRPLDAAADTPYVIETCRLLVQELAVPLIAFAGAPFTVASYLVEGRPSRTYEHTKALMYTDEPTWHALLEHLAGVGDRVDHAASSTPGRARSSCSTRGPVRCRRADYERFVLPHSRRVFQELAASHPGVPGIHFGIGCDHLLESMYSAGPSVIGLDWRTPITAARAPARCPTPGCRATSTPPWCSPDGTSRDSGLEQVIDDNIGHPGHVFNLGHGVQPNTDPGVLEALTAFVHERTVRCIGVLLMAYGTPRHPDEVEAYYTDIRRGRPPTPEQLADLVRRYDAIGGISPLAQRTEAQRDALQAALDATAPGQFSVTLGLKHAEPKIEAGVEALVAAGVESIVALVLAPHFSALSVGQYLDRARAAAAAHEVTIARDRVVGHRAGVRRRSSPPRCAPSWPRCPAQHQGALHRPLAARTGARHGRPVPRRAPRRPPRPLPPRWGSRRGAAGASPGSRPAARRSRGWAPTSSQVISELADNRKRRPVCWSAPAGSSPIISRCSTTSTSRPRQHAERLGLAFSRTACVNDDPTVIGGARRAGRGGRSIVSSDRVAVVGGGITGLAAAWRLADVGIASVVFESTDRFGGKIQASPFGGLDRVEEGPDAFLARVPSGKQLAGELGLDRDRAHVAGHGHRVTSPTTDGSTPSRPDWSSGSLPDSAGSRARR